MNTMTKIIAVFLILIVRLDLVFGQSQITIECAEDVAMSYSGSFNIDYSHFEPTITGSGWQLHGPWIDKHINFQEGFIKVTYRIKDYYGQWHYCYTIITVEPDEKALTVSGNVIPPRCFNESNGSINLTVSGFLDPVYQWSSGQTTKDISGVPGGNYSVVVSERGGGCSTPRNYTITPPSPIIIDDYSVIPTSCEDESDGSITVTASGGTPPYHFQWPIKQGKRLRICQTVIII